MSEQKTDIENRMEIIYLYDAKDCDPNGDPFTGEPRYDESCQKVMVSDVRLKRYIRDYIDRFYSDEEDDNVDVSEKNKIIFYSSLGETETVGQRRDSLADFVKRDDSDDILKKCIDIRLFGCVLAEKGENINLTGTVQFKNLNRSINKVELQAMQNTSVMKTGEEKTQGAMAMTTIVPYALISAIGYVNSKTAESNHTKIEDINLMLKSLWNQVNIMNTRSKTGQTSRLLLLIEYVDGISKISDLENSIELKEEKKDNLDYRDFNEIESDLNFEPLLTKIKENNSLVSSVKFYVDPTGNYDNLEKFIKSLKDIEDIKVEKIDLLDDQK